MSTSVDQYKTE